ncbi:MAG: hypothetical protein K2J33_00315, partial [Alistipes sp.]|nr:hypothetical protein [Alistipes sp.]
LDMIVEPNTTGEERSTVLTLSAEGAESVEITVKQAAIVPEITIADADKTLSVPAEGVELRSIKVTTANLTENVTVTVEPASEWLIADYNAADGTLDIMVEANAAAAERKATVTLSANGVSAAVEVVQAGKEAGNKQVAVFDYTKYTTSNSEYTGETVDGIVLSTISGQSAINSAGQLRIYANAGAGALVIDGGTRTITQIVITFNQVGAFTSTPTGYSVNTTDKVGTWTGSANKVSFSKGGTQARITKITVTYAGSGEPSGPTQLATPEVKATSTSSSVTLTWAEVPGAGGYEYTVGTVTDMTFDTSVTVGDLAEGTYDWSVTAISEDTANYTDSEPATGSVTVSNGGSTGDDQRGAAWTYTFTSNTPKLGIAAQIFNGLSWVSSIAANQYESSGDNRGWQFGSAQGTVTVKTSDYKQSINYVELVVSTNGAGNSVSVTVGGKELGSTVSLSNGDKNKTITFESTELLTGEIVITIKDTAKSVYLKTISI